MRGWEHSIRKRELLVNRGGQQALGVAFPVCVCVSTWPRNSSDLMVLEATRTIYYIAMLSVGHGSPALGIKPKVQGRQLPGSGPVHILLGFLFHS